MKKSKSKIGALFLCFVLGPFGLFYINKTGGIILSVAMILTLLIGSIAAGWYAVNHPMSQEELSLLMAGTIPASQHGLAKILYIEFAAIIAEWVGSMIWALVTPTTEP